MKSTALAILLCAMTHAEVRQVAERHVASHQQAIVRELTTLLSIPNVAADRPNIRRNAELLRDMLARRGFTAEILETEINPLVYGELTMEGARRTLLLYAHYDGQPVDPPLWKQPSPFHPVMREGGRDIPDFLTLKEYPPDARIFARSASDDKAPIVTLLTALDALRAGGQRPTSNVRVILDGEEEASSRGLIGSIGKYKEKFRADLMLILDGPLHPSGRPTLTFGARGNLRLELIAFGAKSALHSGHYGNWAPNPAIELSQLLASMKDREGRVIIEGFYDDVPPLSPEIREALAGVPDDGPSLMKLFGIARTEKVGASLQEALQYPSLNIRGLRSGYVGADARTIIPESATASIDVRLVKENDPAKMTERVLAHIREQGWHVVDREPDDATRARYARIVRVVSRPGMRAHRTELDLPESRLLTGTLDRLWGAPPVRIRTSGGTVPISPFIEALGFPAIHVPTVNFDNNQHTENENLRLGHLWNAIVTFAGILTM